MWSDKLCFAMLCTALLPVGPARAETLSFVDQIVGQVPTGFTVALTGRGGAAKWAIQKAPGGAAGNVVVQTSAEDVDYRFPLLIYDNVTASDLDLSVKFQTVSGRIDQAGGLVWRYRDANKYYVVRANALEDNVVLYKVENGKRSDLPLKGKDRTYGAKAPVPKNTWNMLSVSVRGAVFAVTFNGKPLYEVEDRIFREAGKVGLWTEADSVTMFDALTVAVVK